MRPMAVTHNELIAAALLFVGGHFLLSSLFLRRILVARLGKKVFRFFYSAVVLIAFLLLIYAYANAPYLPLWRAPLILHWVPVLIMPFATFFLVAGLTTPGVTTIGGEDLAEAPELPAHGIYSITRHPVLWAIGLWALSHIVVRGDFSSVFMMGAIAFLAFVGMIHIDFRREVELGAAWGPTRLTTSRIPLAAILAGRCKLDWEGIGFWRLLGTIALYVTMLFFHRTFIGLDALPPL